MGDSRMSGFIHDLAMNEIAVAVSNERISYNEACNFANKIIDRFGNPFIDHQLLSITVQYSSKMKTRNVPLLLNHYRKHAYVPEHMALGFAGYLLFMRCRKNEKGNYTGQANGLLYPVQDDLAAYFEEKWSHNNIEEVVNTILADKGFWETDLSSLKGFAETVKMYLHSLIQNGVRSTLGSIAFNKTVV
jgi:tagaturonate reductase